MKLNLNSVSETALLTLRARVDESEKPTPLILDPMGSKILDIILSNASQALLNRLFLKRIPSTLVNYLALRARKYDAYTSAFLKRSNSLVISLGCGFDTRYWRISEQPWPYIEIDLPEVIDTKQELLGPEPLYEMIGCSVLDHKWIEKIASHQTENVLFLAEGLFMYLPEKEVVQLFKKLADVFSRSELVFEVVQKKYTRGFWKKVVVSKMKRRTGTAAGTSYLFGIEKARDIESYSNRIKIIEEWSYFEDPDIRPRFQKIFRNMKAFSRTQWTIRARLG